MMAMIMQHHQQIPQVRVFQKKRMIFMNSSQRPKIQIPVTINRMVAKVHQTNHLMRNPEMTITSHLQRDRQVAVVVSIKQNVPIPTLKHMMNRRMQVAAQRQKMKINAKKEKILKQQKIITKQCRVHEYQHAWKRVKL